MAGEAPSERDGASFPGVKAGNSALVLIERVVLQSIPQSGIPVSVQKARKHDALRALILCSLDDRFPQRLLVQSKGDWLRRVRSGISPSAREREICDARTTDSYRSDDTHRSDDIRYAFHGGIAGELESRNGLALAGKQSRGCGAAALLLSARPGNQPGESPRPAWTGAPA